MGNERLTVLIGGREALPVRAIPYVAGWQRFSPDVVANYLAHNFKLIWFDSITALTAYGLSGGAPIAIRPREWDEYVAKLAGFEDKVRLQSPTDNIGYAAWCNGAVAKLPAGVFVWLDEFEEKNQAGRRSKLYYERESKNAMRIYDQATYDKLTDKTLDLSPILLDANTRVMVLEGFEDAAQDALTKTTAIGQGKAASDKTSSGDDWVNKRPPQQQQFQEQEILRVIRMLSYDPKKLPKHKPGTSGVKAETREKLSFSVGIFDKAWDRLRANQDIQNVE